MLQGCVTCVWLVRENGDDVEAGGLTIGMAEVKVAVENPDDAAEENSGRGTP